MTQFRHASVAIPVLDEVENISKMIQILCRQTYGYFDIYVCVNNPDDWCSSADPYHISAYRSNQETLRYLSEVSQSADMRAIGRRLHIIDCSSPGRGWAGKRKGVGWARKILFDSIAKDHDDDELVVSLDADTEISPDYIETVVSEFNAWKGQEAMDRHIDAQIRALAVPYYHPLSGDMVTDRAMLRYEIYMRHYLISLFDASASFKTHIPYTFSALGSAMVFSLGGYKKVGGITPLQGGEDFYLLQKFAKAGAVVVDSEALVKPQGRVSRRVPFGTGPAIAGGLEAMETKYPLYSYRSFLDVAQTYSMFPNLYDGDKETPMSDFLRAQLSTNDLWQPLRDNFKTRAHFVHACAERVDGLRILQYLKSRPLTTAEEEIKSLCSRHDISISDHFCFEESPLAEIDKLRGDLFTLESMLRKGKNRCDGQMVG